MAQRCGQNSTQDDNEIEYVEMVDPVPPAPDSQRSIYFTPGDGDRQNQPSSVQAIQQDSDASTYDLAGSSGVYTIHGRNKGKNEKDRSNKKEGFAFCYNVT